ncbi:carotenoid ester lipase precursor [Peniophora sp. CONT]|nr:carotenoid ester lipase precursor [Peniophora sp. CONT]
MHRTRFVQPRVVLDTEVVLDQGIFNGGSAGSTKFWLGVPYAKPPTGDLRYRLPQQNDAYQGTYDATAYGASCLQQTSTQATSLPSNLTTEALLFLQSYAQNTANMTTPGEDCLTVNVVTPSDIEPGQKLPVVVWIYGGGFTTGASSTQNGSTIVEHSIELNMPVIYVSLNYRNGALGFPQGSGARAAGVGNLGLQDQRLALRWVQQYISAFGGDKDKVTLWGQSAGAISISLQMLTNGGNTEGLFHAAWMHSGAPIPTGPIENGQKFWDAYLNSTGCTDGADVFDCLRTLSTADIQSAMNKAPSATLDWVPREDGTFLTSQPATSVASGSVANIPIVSGNVDDEGTLFILGASAITTDVQVAAYLSTALFPNNQTAVSTLLELYPSDPAAGAPFDTGSDNAVTPEWKRLAALSGDLTFTAPRRYFVQTVANEQNTWVFLSKRFKSLDDFGSYHASDLLSVYGPGDMTDYLVRFVTNHDPNQCNNQSSNAFDWPQYTPGMPKILELLDGDVQLQVADDAFRQDALAYAADAAIHNPF